MEAKTRSELEKMGGPELLKLYNQIATAHNERSVKRFSDKKSAVNRIIKITEQKGWPGGTPTGPTGQYKLRAKKGVRASRFKYPFSGNVKKPQEGTKRRDVFDLLSRPGGATLEEVHNKTGWPRGTCIEGVKLIHVAHGYGLDFNETTGKIWIVDKPKS